MPGGGGARKTPLMDRPCKDAGQVRREGTGRCYRPASSVKKSVRVTKPKADFTGKLDRLATKVSDLESSQYQTDKNIMALKKSVELLANVVNGVIQANMQVANMVAKK